MMLTQAPLLTPTPDLNQTPLPPGDNPGDRDHPDADALSRSAFTFSGWVQTLWRRLCPYTFLATFGTFMGTPGAASLR